MNTKNNGYESNRMTGSGSGNNGENLSWLAEVASSQGTIHRLSEGMISSHVTGQVHESSSRSTAMLASASSPASMTGVFRPPMTITDPTQRLMSSGGSQFSTLYSSTGGGGGSGSIAPYSNLQGGHGGASSVQGSHLQSHFGTYYPQYQYSRPVLANPHFPHIESYSAVLQSMGSQVQQATHTQLPRNTYGHVSQYSLLGVSHQRSMSASVSPVPEAVSQHSPLTSGNAAVTQGEISRGDLKSVRSENRDRKILTDQEYLSHIKEERSQSLSIELSGGKSVSFKDPPRRDSLANKDPNYKVPTGKEGSLKHRILTRPSDSSIQSSVVDSRYSSQTSQHCTQEPSQKRTKNDHSGSTKSPHSTGDLQSGSFAPHYQPTVSISPSPQLHYPPHFMKGSIIQLTNGELKRVEDLQTEDFVQSAEISSDLKIDSSTVVKIEEINDRSTAVLGFVVGEHKVQVTVEATLEHPFFVFGQGWSSCEPERTLQRYGLECQRLSVGDVCISLTHKDVTAKAAEISQQQQKQLEQDSIPSPSRTLKSGRSPKYSPGQNQGHNVNSPSYVRSGNSPSEAQELSDQNNMPPRKRHWSNMSQSGERAPPNNSEELKIKSECISE